MTRQIEIEGVALDVEYTYYESPSGHHYVDVDNIFIAGNSVIEVLSDFVIQKVEEALDASIVEDEWNAAEDKGDARRKYDE